ncbi:assimilatory sulfite reductase (NADPH) flavoprotein subunit [Methylococcus geothermalis]|uniref:assimilatory sulfite reductase (NADPH) flavoprotein subunit n=1 Tax=Methylococcus geothermalis TaxID=2681310 RepID=UPI001E63DB37|nr:assimilatory sulfite reductase (NADPH) flavoprotein subunit [Methylococcus geothermalis]
MNSKMMRYACSLCLAWLVLAAGGSALAAERHSDPDGCFSCHGLPGLEYLDDHGVLRVATILKSDYYGSLHGSVPCKDCHRKIERYPHKPEEGYVDCSESCHLNEPSKDKAFTHKPVVDEFKTSVHGAGHAPGATKDFHGGNRLEEETGQQNPSCRRCHSNTPYIKDANLERFKQELHHTETECGTCHQGETWRNQFSGHILRRLVGKNYNKMEANAMCVDCHGNHEAMAKVEIQDPETKERKKASFRFAHAADSYAKTLHGRLLAVNDESGASCIDCHAPDGFRHGILRDESKAASTHPDRLGETCSQAGCHGYARSPLNLGFLNTDLHDLDFLRMEGLSFALDFSRLDSAWYAAAWVLGPLGLIFLVSSFLSPLSRSRQGPVTEVVGYEHFQRVMIGSASAKAGLWRRILPRLAGRSSGSNPAAAAPVVEPDAPITSLTLLFGSQTGNGEGVAADLEARLKAWGYSVKRVDMADYDPQDIVNERLLFVIVSTHGEGQPPIPAEKLHGYLYAETAPRLEHLKFAVFALGDSSYKYFCKAGKDFDAFLQRLGASRVLDRVDADADFEEAAAAWIEAVLGCCRSIIGDTGIEPPREAEPTDQAAVKAGYGKTNPYPAAVRRNVNLNGDGSAKETRHIEIDLGDSGLSYEPGDALGVYPKNNPAYVEALLVALQADGYAEVTLGKETLTLREAFYKHLDITGLSRVLVEKYAELSGSRVLAGLLADADPARLDGYLWGRQIIDLIEDFPLQGIPPQTFVDLLRRMPPRLYSIASSMKAHPGQVHLTVGVVRYHAHGRDREGVCSTYLAGRVGADERLAIFVQPNKHFRLPKDPATPLIMVGPGTGIAPFRGFVEEREATGAAGKNWLYFGDQRRATDYLYREEWEDKLSRGVLTRLDLAFSRDQERKVYVQTRMLENARDMYAWLEEGACFYVCGDASRMAHDVHQALLTIVMQEGGRTREQAEDYLEAMAASQRYLRDVY